jgi:hypothetical protein
VRHFVSAGFEVDEAGKCLALRTVPESSNLG